MPDPFTFQMKPIREMIDRWMAGKTAIVDPFCGNSEIAHFRNDLRFVGGVDAAEYVKTLIRKRVRVDGILFDPPYSPRQIKECYNSVGRDVTARDTQNGRLYKEVRDLLRKIALPGCVSLSFGWNLSGFGVGWTTVDKLVLDHGGAHSSTLCVCQISPGRK
jgi:hypothetical protein